MQSYASSSSCGDPLITTRNNNSSFGTDASFTQWNRSQTSIATDHTVYYDTQGFPIPINWNLTYPPLNPTLPNILSLKDDMGIINHGIAIKHKDIFIDRKNDTIVIFDIYNLLNSKIYKLSSLKLDLETQTTASKLLLKKRNANRKLLTEKTKLPAFFNSFGFTCFGNANNNNCTNYNACYEMQNYIFNNNNLFCKLSSELNNTYIDMASKIAYVYNGFEWKSYTIKNFVLTFDEHKNVADFKNKNKERKLLTEKYKGIECAFTFTSSSNGYIYAPYIPLLTTTISGIQFTIGCDFANQDVHF